MTSIFLYLCVAFLTILNLAQVVFGLIQAVILLLIGLIFKSEKIKQYAANLLLSWDQLMNTIWCGDCDESISSRVGKSIREGSKRWLPNYLNRELDKAQKDHSIKSIEDDEGKKQIKL